MFRAKISAQASEPLSAFSSGLKGVLPVSFLQLESGLNCTSGDFHRLQWLGDLLFSKACPTIKVQKNRKIKNRSNIS